MSKNSFEIIKVGSRVKLTDDVVGQVLSVTIHSDNHVSYECGWWNGRSYSAESFAANQIETTTEERTKIGFV